MRVALKPVAMAVPMLVSVLMLIVPMAAAALVLPMNVFRPMSMPFMPVGRAFGPFVVVCFGFAGVLHGGFLVRFVV